MKGTCTQWEAIVTGSASCFNYHTLHSAENTREKVNRRMAANTVRW